MKIVVTSDTHGHKEILNRIVEENRDAELFYMRVIVKFLFQKSFHLKL